MTNKIPSSISQIIYKSPVFYKVLFAVLIGFMIYSKAYIAAVGLSMVYIFRYFMFQKEKTPHYVGAGIFFLGLVLHTGVLWPIGLGAVSLGILKLFKNEDYIFWFEITAGIPYIYYLI